MYFSSLFFKNIYYNIKLLKKEILYKSIIEKMARGKRTTTKKQQKATEPAPEVATPAPATNEVVQTTAPVETTEPSLGDEFATLLGQLNGLRTQITSLSAQLRALRTRSEREIRLAQKQARKRKNTNRKPSGFVKPTKISTELASFLSKPKGTEMARTEVTREINAYIREHNLQNPKNRRHILPDTKLRKLLKIGKNDELTYFNLQKYMSPHFAKSEASK